MSYANPIWLEGWRKYWMRHDAYRFAPPGSPEAKMPGWLDPWATRVRAKEAAEAEARAQEAAAQEEFERELLQLRWEVKKLKLEHELWCFEQKYSPSQPRVPGGSPQGGQWTSSGGESEPLASMVEQAREPIPPSSTSPSGEENSESLKPVLVQMAGDNRPLYEKADSALLAPKGINAASSEQRLRYTLDGDGRYLGGVTVVMRIELRSAG